jgi:DNA mismatch endonuclease (patch repair protein)
MRAIKGRDTAPELAVRRALHARGFRFLLHSTRLAGKPDLTLPKHRAVVLVHGCFWHQHDCHLFKLPEERRVLWEAKLAGNVLRDEQVKKALASDGWRIATVWECSLRGRTRQPINQVADQLAIWLRGKEKTITIRGFEEGIRHVER